jgi:hypothetical protein
MPAARPIALAVALVLALSRRAGADAPPPSQELATDPAPPAPRLGVSADGIALALADYALRLDGSLLSYLSVSIQAGASRRHGGDAAYVGLGVGLWPLDEGLEGFFVAGSVGVAWAGPWNGDAPGARDVGRAEGELGWQFLWEDLSLTLAAGVSGFWAPEQGTSWAEPHGRAALGVVLR